MPLEVGAVGAEGLQRDDAAGPEVTAVKECLKTFQNRGVGGLRQQAEQLAVAFDQTAQDARDGKGPVAMRDGSQNLAGELFPRTAPSAWPGSWNKNSSSGRRTPPGALRDS